MISRIQATEIRAALQGTKAVILLGPRQVGKTTLLQNLFQDDDVLWLNGDEADTRDMLEQPNATRLKAVIGKHKLLVIDEAQRISNIGLCLKIIVDQIKTVKVIATGSSSFDLANKIKEPLTGRKQEFQLFPVSFGEMTAHHGLLTEKRLLEQRLIYGYYPEAVTTPDQARSIIKSLADSYLYKDILIWENIKKPQKLEKLIQALAFQIGSEVSFNELGQHCGIDKGTVEHYIDILERAFVVFTLPSFGRNLRNELKKSKKIYFHDNGIRNAVINQFSPLASRNDTGALWENFVISERMKKNRYQNVVCNRYFWRTTAQQEIDYLEENNGEISAWEFKWNEKKKVKFPLTFTKAYAPGKTLTVSPANLEEFVL